MTKPIWRPPTVSQLVRPETTHDEFENILKFVTECEQNYLIKMCLDEFNSKIWDNFPSLRKVK